MANFNPTFSYNTFLILIAIVAALYAGWKVKVPIDSNKILRANNQDLSDRLKIVEADNVTLKTLLAKLQGQVETYKELPLQELATSIQRVAEATANNSTLLSSITETNKQIVDQLKVTATIAAEDRDVLTNQNVHIRSEVHKEIGNLRSD